MLILTRYADLENWVDIKDTKTGTKIKVFLLDVQKGDRNKGRLGFVAEPHVQIHRNEVTDKRSQQGLD